MKTLPRLARFVMLLSALGLAFSALRAHAATVYWNVPGPADFNQGSNWSTGTFPGTGDQASIQNGGTATIGATPPNAVSELWVGNGGVAGNLSMSAGTLDVTNWMVAGRGTNTPLSTFTMIGGTVNSRRTLIGSDGSNAHGEFDLSGSSVFNNSEYMSIGTAGGSFGTLRMSDNVQLLVSGDLNVSDQNGSTGTLYLDGGLAQGGTVYVGKGAGTVGTVVQNGGQMVANGDLYIASGGGSTGSYTLNNNGQIIVNGGVLRVGYNGAGTLTQTGGSISTANWFVVGQGGSDTSIYAMSGGTLDVNTNGGGEMLQVGVSGTVDAYMNLSGNAVVTVHDSAIQIGSDQATATGTVRVADNAYLVAPVIRVGHYGTGNLIQTGGTVETTSWLVISQQPNSVGTYDMSGGTLNVNTAGGGNFQIGVRDNGIATFNLSGDAVVNVLNGASVRLGSDTALSQGTVTQSGNSALHASSYLSIGAIGTGTYTLRDNATLDVAGDLNVSDTPNSTGTLYLDGGLARGNVVFIGKGGGSVGTVYQTGGELHSNNYLCIGTTPTSTGEYHLGGGTLYANTDLNVSDQTNSTGTLYLDGGLANGGTVFVGKSSGTVGTVFQTGGETYSRGGFLVANSGGSTGVYHQSGGLVAVNGNPQIGVNGQGTLDQTGGMFYHVNHMAVSRYGGSQGTYNISDGINAGRWMIVAEDGGTNGQVNVSAGAVVSLGGSSVSPASLEVARNGAGTVAQTGGMVYADTVMIGSGASGNGTYNLQNGVLETRNLSIGPGTGAFNFTGGLLRVGIVGFSLNNQGGALDVSTPMTAGWNVKWYPGNGMTDTPDTWVPPAPTGTQIVDAVAYDGSAPPGGYPGGSSDYYGAVYTASLYAPVAGNYSFRERVDDSSLLKVDGTMVLWDYTAASDFGEPAGNPWVVNAFTTVPLAAGWHDLEFRWSDHYGGQNAYLEWDPAGGQNWSLMVGGAVFADVGSEIGTATIDGDYTQGGSGRLLIDVDAATMTADKLVVTGTLNAGGTLEVSLLDDLLPPYNSTFDILDFGAVGSEFDSFASSPLPPAVYWDLSRLYLTGEITLRVPEPATWTLAALGGLILAALGLVRRRRKR